MTFNPSQVKVTPAPAVIWGGRGDGGSILVYNPDPSNTVYVSGNSGITVGASNTLPLGPGQSVSLGDSDAIYACALAGTAPVIVIPGGAAFFLGLTQAQGQLALASIRSPDFVHGATGWSINKDGSAEFHDIIIPAGSGGTVVTFGATAPGSPNVGDVWYNTSAGLEASVWSGAAWVPWQIGSGAIATGGISASNLSAAITARSLGGITTTIAGTAPGSPNAGDIWINSASGNQLEQWTGSAWSAIAWTATNVIAAGTITASLITAATITGSLIAAGTIVASNIQANTITASQIAAGTITATQIAAGTITGTNIAASIGLTTPTITGTDYIINSHGIFFYSAAPASGNLIASIAPYGGTDPYGNAYIPGIVSYGAGNAVAGMTLTTSGTQGAFEIQPEATYIGASASPIPAFFATTFNNGLTSEYVEAISQSGAPSAHPAAQSKVVLFSGSEDGTTSVPHMWLVAGASGNMVADVTSKGIVAANPNVTNADETWHPISLSSGWTVGDVAPSVRMLPDGNVQVTGDATHASFTAATQLGTLPSGYAPTTRKRMGAAGANAYFDIQTSGVVNAAPFNSSTAATFATCDGTYPLGY